MPLPEGLVAIVPARESAGRPDQHLDLEVLAGFLRAAGFRVLLLDGHLHGLDVEEALATALRERPVAVYWHLPGRRELKAVTRVLDRPTGPGEPVHLAGGYFGSRQDLAILSALKGLDAVVHGELEEPMSGLLRALVRGEPWLSTPGLVVRRGGVAVRNPRGRLLEDLDALPMAASDLFHASRLSSGQKVLLNRGCDSDCAYCGLQVPYREDFHDRKRFWRSRSPGRIVDEIEHYAIRHGVRRFVLQAFVLFGYDERGEAVIAGVADEIARRGLAVEFSFVTHPGALARNAHLLPRLRRAGLADLLLGIDSGLESALRRYRVGFGLDDIFAALSTLHGHGVPFDIGFFFVDPWTTFDEIRDQLAFLRRIRPFFGHMARPYSFFLDQQLLASALYLNAGMPLLAALAADGLLVPADPLLADPAARFADPRTGKFYAIHQRFRRSSAYRSLRPRLLAPGSLPEALEELPLAVAERLWDLLAERPDVDMEDAARRLTEIIGVVD